MENCLVDYEDLSSFENVMFLCNPSSNGVSISSSLPTDLSDSSVDCNEHAPKQPTCKAKQRERNKSRTYQCPLIHVRSLAAGVQSDHAKRDGGLISLTQKGEKQFLAVKKKKINLKAYQYGRDNTNRTTKAGNWKSTGQGSVGARSNVPSKKKLSSNLVDKVPESRPKDESFDDEPKQPGFYNSERQTKTGRAGPRCFEYDVHQMLQNMDHMVFAVEDMRKEMREIKIALNNSIFQQGLNNVNWNQEQEIQNSDNTRIGYDQELEQIQKEEPHQPMGGNQQTDKLVCRKTSRIPRRISRDERQASEQDLRGQQNQRQVTNQYKDTGLTDISPFEDLQLSTREHHEPNADSKLWDMNLDGKSENVDFGIATKELVNSKDVACAAAEENSSQKVTRQLGPVKESVEQDCWESCENTELKRVYIPTISKSTINQFHDPNNAYRETRSPDTREIFQESVEASLRMQSAWTDVQINKMQGQISNLSQAQNMHDLCVFEKLADVQRLIQQSVLQNEAATKTLQTKCSSLAELIETFHDENKTLSTDTDESSEIICKEGKVELNTNHALHYSDLEAIRENLEANVRSTLDVFTCQLEKTKLEIISAVERENQLVRDLVNKRLTRGDCGNNNNNKQKVFIKLNALRSRL